MNARVEVGVRDGSVGEGLSRDGFVCIVSASTKDECRGNARVSMRATLSERQTSMFSAQLSLAPVNQAGIEFIGSERSMICGGRH